jgi:hypothetical protein
MVIPRSLKSILGNAHLWLRLFLSSLVKSIGRFDGGSRESEVLS